ncbi:hypothetical protein IV203_032963 [Nitzschia inconspicua]|uniref:Uncharacterized protein n=1 Tax=Nitzschia inconspicua TaxID=303405 RepID=A0A9K3PFA2_9STRA|nr:hypothetical protein IV203_032963 [Nitzschia inconspicua]
MFVLCTGNFHHQEPPDLSEYEAKNYSSLFEELKKRATLHDANVRTNSWARSVKTKVWTILHAIFEGHPAYVHIHPFSDKLDGPAAYQALWDQCLGLNNISHVAAEIDRELAKLVYTQETKRWNFDRYVDTHVDLYQRTQALVPFGISGMDGKHTRSAKVVAVSAPIGNRKQKGHNPKPKRHKGSNGQVASVEVEDWYYIFQEYKQLSPDSKQRLKELRMKRHRKSGGNRKESQKQKSPRDIVEEMVNAMTATDDEADSLPDDPAPVTNRNNPALTRQHSKPKFHRKTSRIWVFCLRRPSTSYVTVRRPTPVEIGHEDLERFELTYSTPDWEPGSLRYSSLEEQLLEGNSLRLTTGDLVSTAETSKTSVRRLNVVKQCVISAYECDHSQSSALLANISPILCGDLLAQAMNERYCVAAFQVTPSAHGLGDSWESLSALKESNPVEVAEYAVAHNLTEELAFSWWVPYTLKKRDAIVLAVNNRYWKRTQKYGIRIPKTVKEAFEIDHENGDNRWAESIQKEMNAVRVAFRILGEDQKVPPGYQYMKCHLVFCSIQRSVTSHSRVYCKRQL